MFDRLTLRETDVVKLVAEGLSNRDIGNTLNMAESTVKKHLTHIFGKTKLRKRVELAVCYQRLRPTHRES